MPTIATLRRLNTHGVLGGRRLATAVAGFRGGAVVASRKTTARPSYSNVEGNFRFSLIDTNEESICYTQQRQFHNSVVAWKDYPDHTIVPFPALSPTMEIGTIAKWEISEGEEFSAGSVIASIETDKATMDFEAQDDGILAKILRDGSDATDLPIGTPIAIVVEEPEDVAAFSDYVMPDNESSGTEDMNISPSDPPSSAEAPASDTTSTSTPVVGGASGSSFLLPSARFLAESKYVAYVDSIYDVRERLSQYLVLNRHCFGNSCDTCVSN